MADWRAMTPGDLGAVTAISATVHGRYAEPFDVYAERLALYPAGCLVWADADRVSGLLVTHPWKAGPAPRLGELLGKIPDSPDRYYLHDVALLPTARGQGAGRTAVALVDALARRAGMSIVTLVAVNGADRFWASQGFGHDDDPAAVGYGAGSFPMRRLLP